jgi:hypothetical protein
MCENRSYSGHIAATNFHHNQRSGRRKQRKQRSRRASLGIGGDAERLLAHRELEFLRRADRFVPGYRAVMAERAGKLAQAHRAVAV